MAENEAKFRIILFLALSLLLPGTARAATAASVGGCAGTTPGRILNANPSTYRALLDAGLLPGDFLRLAAGTYTQGLPFSGHNGAAGNCALISPGPLREKTG